MCDPLGEEDITVEEDPLGYNEELEVKDEPFEFFDDPSCWPSHRGANCNDDDDEEFPGLEILSVDDIAKDDGDDSNHLELIEMIEVGGPDTCSSAADLSLPEEVPSSSSVADTLAEESHSPSQFSTDLDKEKLDALVKREANILKTQERREKEMVKKKELQRQLEVHRIKVKRLQKELDEEKKKMHHIQNQLINLRRRVRRQELKIKQVGGSLLSNLDTGQDPLKDKKLVDVPPLALGADGYGETPKGKRKVGESSSSVGRADAKADSMKGKRKGVEHVSVKFEGKNDTIKGKKRGGDASLIKLEEKDDEYTPKKKPAVTNILDGFKGRLKVSVKGLAMKRKIINEEEPKKKKMTKVSEIKKGAAGAFKECRKKAVVSLVRCSEVQQKEMRVEDQKIQEKESKDEKDQKMGDRIKQGSSKELVKVKYGAELDKIKQEDLKINGLNTGDDLQFATSSVLWNVMSRVKTQPYATVSSKRKTSEVYPNHYFQRQCLAKTTTAELPKLVEKFMEREDISKISSVSLGSESPDTSLRYRMHYLSVLYKQFESEFGNVCTYKSFAEYVPKNVDKPSPSHWKTCICFPCINPDLKYEKLKSKGLIGEEKLELADVLQDAEKETELRTQLCTLRDSKEILTYNLWERNSSGTVNSKLRSASEPVAIVAAKFLEELSLLKSHIQRIFCQFDSARSARERALDSWDEVTFHLDCSPLPIYPYPGQENGASEPVTMLTALSGYIWSRGGGQKIIALSDSKDYTFAGVWAAMEKTLLKMVEAGKKKINIISDSPTNKYRNKSTFYYLTDFAQTHGVCLRWVFLELCHSIGNAGIVKSELESVIRQQISANPEVSVRCANELVNLVRPHSSAVIHMYTERDVQRYKCMLPKLRVIQGTQKFVEVIVFPDDFWARDAIGSDSFKKLSF